MKNQNDDRTQRRLQILGENEIAAMYARPLFNYEERVHYFSLSPPEKAALQQFHTFPSRIFYILQLGYFKARRQFFTFTIQDVAVDAGYVQQTYFPDFPLTDFGIAKGTRGKQQRIILELFCYRFCTRAERRLLVGRARQAARISSKPIYILRDLLQYLAEQRIVAPSYTVLQDIVGRVLTAEQERLVRIADEHLAATDVAALRKLLTNPHGLYEITRLKREPRDFGYEAMARESGGASKSPASTGWPRSCCHSCRFPLRASSITPRWSTSTLSSGCSNLTSSWSSSISSVSSTTVTSSCTTTCSIPSFTTCANTPISPVAQWAGSG